jgi:TRAP-type C4-dicarboxylate transport system permease small subunit
MTLLVISDIGGRELFGTGLAWAQKIAVYMMIWAGFIGASITQGKGGHLRPEIADKIWPAKFHGQFHTIRWAVTAVFCLFAAYHSFLYLQESIELGDRSPIVDFPLWIVQTVIPITFILMALQAIIFSLFKDIRPAEKREGQS